PDRSPKLSTTRQDRYSGAEDARWRWSWLESASRYGKNPMPRGCNIRLRPNSKAGAGARNDCCRAPRRLVETPSTTETAHPCAAQRIVSDAVACSWRGCGYHVAL